MSAESFFLDGVAVRFVDDAPAALAMARAQALQAEGIRTWSMPSPGSTAEEPRIALIVPADRFSEAETIIDRIIDEAPAASESPSPSACPACESPLTGTEERCPECSIRLA